MVSEGCGKKKKATRGRGDALFWREVILDVESHAYLLGRLALDLVGDGLASEGKE